MFNAHKLCIYVPSKNFFEVQVIGEFSDCVLANKALLRDKDVSDGYFQL